MNADYCIYNTPREVNTAFSFKSRFIPSARDGNQETDTKETSTILCVSAGVSSMIFGIESLAQRKQLTS